MSIHKTFLKKVRITGKLVFETAFHIGSGKEGELATNMGILQDPDGNPVLPGSTLKGSFRSFAERMAPHLEQSACLLDASLSGTDCVAVEDFRRKVYDKYKEITKEQEKLKWLKDKTCDVCRLFGSPLQTSRIFFSDGKLIQGGDDVQIRDGVCIDRDTETARYGAKYDFEVVTEGAVYEIFIDIENPEDKELALVGAALAEWEYGFRLGGFTSRGLGKVRLKDTKIEQVDYTDPDQLKDFLIHRRMTPADSLLADCLNDALKAQGGKHA